MDVAHPLGIREGVEQAGVDNGIEGPAELLQAKRVLHQELDGETALPSLPPCGLDGPHRRVHPTDLVPAPGEEERVLPGPAPGVQDGARDLPRLIECREGWLRPPDLPVWGPPVRLVEDAHAGGRSPVRGDDAFPAPQAAWTPSLHPGVPAGADPHAPEERNHGDGPFRRPSRRS